MNRSILLAIVLVVPAAGCGSSSSESVDTVGAVSDSLGSVPDDAATGDAPSRTDAPDVTEVPITQLSPNANPDLVDAVGSTTSDNPGDFDLDPESPLVRGAVDDLADRLGMSTAEVSVVSARAVTWGDSSLGCPQPGMQYLQRIIDGSLVVLEAGGATYEYHGGSPLELCEQPTRPVGG